MQKLISLSCVLVLLCGTTANPILAADRDGTDAPSMNAHSRVDSSHIETLHRMDRNRDGILKSGEIAKGAESFVADLAKDAGLDHTQPIPLPRLTHRLNLRRVHAASVEVVLRLDQNSDGLLDPDEIPKHARRFVKRVVKESGRKRDTPIKLKHLHRRHMGRFAALPDDHYDGPKTKGLCFSSVKEALVPARILISIYDTSDDGILQKREWAALHKDWGQDDSNEDGQLVDKEVARRLFLFSST